MAPTHNEGELVVWGATKGLENASQHVIQVEGLLHHFAQLAVFG